MAPTTHSGRQIRDGGITHDDIAAANVDGVAATPSMRTLGTGSQQAAAGNDSRFATPSGVYAARTDVASTTNVDLSAVASDYVNFTGSTQIESLGTVAAGIEKLCRFASTSGFKHNGTSLICPGGTDYVGEAGDHVVVRSKGSGNWEVVSWMRFNAHTGGGLYYEVGVSAAGTTHILSTNAETVLVSGSGGPITAFPTATKGTVKRLIFSGTPTITHHATSMINLTGADVVVAAGDVATFMSLGSGNWKMVGYARADGSPLAGASTATQAQMEAGSSTTAYVSPGRQQYHPSAAKGWVNVNMTGTMAVRGSYNVSGITDGGTGLVNIQWDVNFSSGNYSVSVTTEADSGVYASFGDLDADDPPATTDVGILVANDLPALMDAVYAMVQSWGDQ